MSDDRTSADPLPVDHIDECAEVLDRVFAYIDGEITDHVEEIRAHLDECAPCLRQYDLEVALKALVRRSCQDRAPDALRARILSQLQQARSAVAEVTSTQVTSTQVTSAQVTSVRLADASGSGADLHITEITSVRVTSEG